MNSPPPSTRTARPSDRAFSRIQPLHEASVAYRDAVRAARKAFEPWAERTAMNRGQILYRVAELMEGRREQFATEVAAAETDVGLDFGINRFRGDHFGKFFHQGLRAAAQAVDVLADEAVLFHRDNYLISIQWTPRPLA